MKLKVIVGILVFLIAVNLATLGSYIYYRWQEQKQMNRFQELVGRDGMLHRPGRRGPIPRIRLKPDQKQQLRHLMQNLQRQLAPDYQEMQQYQEKVFQALVADRPQLDSIQHYLKAIQDIQFRIKWATVRQLQQARSFLSEEQFRQLVRAAVMLPEGGRRHWHRPGRLHGGAGMNNPIMNNPIKIKED
ncbi:MAG: hypothetical protein GXO78_00235 [Calditrichaeota bacterium]|nr:hypothetical protein [Calditrichota bacterium]